MRIVRRRGEPAIIILSKSDIERAEKIDSSIFLRDSEFPKDAKVAKWKTAKEIKEQERNKSRDHI